MSRFTGIVAIISLSVLCVGLAWGQHGTANLPSAVAWQADETEVSSQIRLFEGTSNDSYDFAIRGELNNNAEVGLGWFTMSTMGEDPIGDAVRASNLDLLTLDLKWQVADGTTRGAIRTGAEFPTSATIGMNTATGAFVWSNRAIPFISAIIERGDPDGWLWILEPKGVGFDADMAASDGTGTVEGFGNLFMVGAGVRRASGQIDLFADAAYPISGENSIDEDTNRVERELAWSAGGTLYLGGTHNWTLDVFATNTAGPSAATSCIVAPDQSVGLGVGIGGEF